MSAHLVYVDILGFEKLAEEISRRRKIDSREIRKKFREIMGERVEIVEESGKIKDKVYGKKDDWIIISDSLDNVFEAIYLILNHRTPYEDYRQIPLEIAIGSVEYDEWVKYDNESIIDEESTVKLLKTKITEAYHKNHESPRSTFIVLTEDVYKQLEPFDKKFCIKEKYKGDIFFSVDVEKFKRRGILFKFLEKINQPKHGWYRRIDELYIEPEEYQQIVEVLENKKIVFITGTPGYGKTYTAVRIMWEFYNKGYEPRWIKGGSPEQREKVRERMSEIERELEDMGEKTIVYFEDPFGFTEYERRDDLKLRINHILNHVRTVRDAYVIITSRKDIFKKFEKESYSAEKIAESEKELNIVKPSYSEEKSKILLKKWAEEKNCRWYGDRNLTNKVIESIENGVLPAIPLTIFDFVEATKDIGNLEVLEEKIRTYSKSIEKVFADEIIGLYKSGRKDRVLLLAITFLMEYSRITVIKRKYEELASENFESFEQIINEEYRLTIESWTSGGEEHLGFAHPTYREAVHYIIKNSPEIREIFSDIIQNLFFEDTTPERELSLFNIVHLIAENFSVFKKDTRDILLYASDDDHGSFFLAYAIETNFNKIPKNIRNVLIKNIIDNSSSMEIVIRLLSERFDSFSEEFRNEMILRVFNSKRELDGLANLIITNFHELPDKITKLLFELAKMEKYIGEVVYAIAENFQKLPEKVRQLLLEVAKNNENTDNIAYAIICNFENVSEDVKALLFRLAKNEDTAYMVAQEMIEGLDKIPEGVRDELLLILIDKKETAPPLSEILAENFNIISEEVRNRLLFELVEKDDAAYGLALAIAFNFESIPPNIRKNLFQYIEEENPDILYILQYHTAERAEDLGNKRLSQREL